MMRLSVTMVSMILMSLPVAGWCQDWGRWKAGPVYEFTDFSAYVAEPKAGDPSRMEILCAADIPYVLISLTSTIQNQRPAEVAFRIDRQSMIYNGVYQPEGNLTGWLVMADQSLLSSLKSGSRAEVAVDGQSGSFRLNGSRAAIDAALAGCGSGSGYQPTWTNFYPTTTSTQTASDDGAVTPARPPSSEQAGRAGAPIAPTTPRGFGSNGFAQGAVPVQENAPTSGEGQTQLMPVTSEALVARAFDACMSQPLLEPGAVLIEDLDGDNRLDILFDWSHVSCPASATASSQKGAGMCGMQNCSIDVYLSSVYKPSGWPQPIMNHMEIPPEILSIDDRVVIRTSFSGGSCPFAEVCTQDWQFNGNQLAVLP